MLGDTDSAQFVFAKGVSLSYPFAFLRISTSDMTLRLSGYDKDTTAESCVAIVDRDRLSFRSFACRIAFALVRGVEHPIPNMELAINIGRVG